MQIITLEDRPSAADARAVTNNNSIRKFDDVFVDILRSSSNGVTIRTSAGLKGCLAAAHPPQSLNVQLLFRSSSLTDMSNKRVREALLNCQGEIRDICMKAVLDTIICRA